jgi:hypothetical protein
MTDKAISPLRRRLIEDMTIRRLPPGTQHQYIRHVKSFADFVSRSPDKATPEDVRRYRLRLASIATTMPTRNAGASALRFFFKVTLKRPDRADAVVSVREPRRLPPSKTPTPNSPTSISATKASSISRLLAQKSGRPEPGRDLRGFCARSNFGSAFQSGGSATNLTLLAAAGPAGLRGRQDVEIAG